jgi:hypothetical protein
MVKRFGAFVLYVEFYRNIEKNTHRSSLEPDLTTTTANPEKPP